MSVDELLNNAKPGRITQLHHSQKSVWFWGIESRKGGFAADLPESIFRFLEGGELRQPPLVRDYPTEEAALAALADAVRRYKAEGK